MRWIELLEGAGNRLSMTRLLMFMAFWPASYAFVKNPSPEMAAVFLGAFVLSYVGGKRADALMGKVELATGSDSDTVSDTAVTGTIVENRRTQTTKRKRRAL